MLGFSRVEGAQTAVRRDSVISLLLQGVIGVGAERVERGEVHHDVGEHLFADVAVGVTVEPASDDVALIASGRHDGGHADSLQGDTIAGDFFRSDKGKTAHFVLEVVAIFFVGFGGTEFAVTADTAAVHQGLDPLFAVQADQIEVGTVAIKGGEELVHQEVFDDLISRYLGDTFYRPYIFELDDVFLFHGNPLLYLL